MNNRLKQIIAKKLEKAKAKGKKKSAMQELHEVAEVFGVSFWTVLNWYSNKYQPQGENFYKLAEHYKVKWQRFYYKKVKISL